MEDSVGIAAVVALALLFAFAGTASTERGRPLFPTGEHKANLVLVMTSLVLAFIAGLMVSA